MFSRVIECIFCCNLGNRNMLREVTVNIGLEKINTQKRVIVEVLLDSSATGLVISLEFAKKQRFKLKKIKRLIYVRNINSFFNKKGSIEHTVEVNIHLGREWRSMWSIVRNEAWFWKCHGLLVTILKLTRE